MHGIHWPTLIAALGLWVLMEALQLALRLWKDLRQESFERFKWPKVPPKWPGE